MTGWAKLEKRRPHGAKQELLRVDEMNRTYEIMFIVRPDVEEADLEQADEVFPRNVVTRARGEEREKIGPASPGLSTVRKSTTGLLRAADVAIAGAGILRLRRRLCA